MKRAAAAVGHAVRTPAAAASFVSCHGSEWPGKCLGRVQLANPGKPIQSASIGLFNGKWQ